MVLDKFNVQWSSSCKATDYLFVGQVAKYTKLWLCGSQVPSGFKSLKSKKDTMTIKFHSDGSVKKPGFKARFIGKYLILMKQNSNIVIFQQLDNGCLISTRKLRTKAQTMTNHTEFIESSHAEMQRNNN